MREGRGRLSTLDMVPDCAGDDILWALGELNKRQRTQADILFELNDRLSVHGVAPISKSAFNRRSVGMSVSARRINDRRAIFAGLAEQYTPEEVDHFDIVLGQYIKTLIAEILDNPDIPPKDALSLARGYLATVQGQKISSERRSKLTEEFKKQTVGAVDAVVKQKGLTQETSDAIKAAIFGLKA